VLHDITESEIVSILLKNTISALVSFIKYNGHIKTVRYLIDIGKEAYVALLYA
jgi:hypothetical protein